jgi:hypothetical protein
MAMVRYNTNNVNFTPGAISSRTPLSRVYGNGRMISIFGQTNEQDQFQGVLLGNNLRFVILIPHFVLIVD